MTSKVLVTGGAGFIGSNLVDALVLAGHHVTVIDDFSAGKAQNLTEAGAGITVIRASILDSAALAQAAEGASTIFHLAAIASVQQCLDRPAEARAVNVEGTLRVAEAAARAGARLVFSSSSAVYGDTVDLPVSETAAPRPLSPYAEHKLLGEEGIRALPGLSAVCFRYFNVYGPRQDPNSEYAAVIPKFATRALTGRPLIIYGTGEQTRDFVYVTDVVRANLLAMGAALADGRPLNIGSGHSISVKELAETTIRAAGSNSIIQYEPPREGEVLHSSARVDEAKAVLGFEASVALDEGLRQTLDFWRAASK